MHFFAPYGYGWKCPAMEGKEFERPPFGVTCIACNEPITWADRGVLLPRIGRDYDPGDIKLYTAETPMRPSLDGLWFTLTVWHLVCFLLELGVPEETARSL